MNTLYNTLKTIVRKGIPSTHDSIKKLLQKELHGAKNVLDLGCGERSPLYLLKTDPTFNNMHSVGVDIFSPYILKNMHETKIHSEYLTMNIFAISFPDKSFDCALLFDVIEHFDRADFLNFLPTLEKVTKKILIITPNGYIDQDEYDHNPYQAHRSGWTVEDFNKLGFTCYGLSGSKKLRNLSIKPRFLHTLVCDISQLFLSKKPKKCFHLIAIKTCPTT
jgi:SAM-dependent methyltransferase